MRLTDWRRNAPHTASMSDTVMATVEPVLGALGVVDDTPTWVAWGDDPDARYMVLALTPAGLVTCNVRVNVPQEGPRASGKLIRWSRVQLGELSVEGQAGRAMLTFQLEGQLLRGVDDEARRVAAFAQDVFAAIDGRPMPSLAAAPAPAAPRSRKAATTNGRRTGASA